MRLLLGCLMIGAVLAIAAAPVRLMAAENLIRNGDLEGVNQDEYNYRPLRDAKDKKIEDSKWSIFAEDNGNHCFRIDILRYVTDSDGKKTVNACVAVGGSKGYDFHDGRKAFEVEPDMIVTSTFPYRGGVPGMNDVIVRGSGFENRSSLSCWFDSLSSPTVTFLN